MNLGWWCQSEEEECGFCQLDRRTFGCWFVNALGKKWFQEAAYLFICLQQWGGSFKLDKSGFEFCELGHDSQFLRNTIPISCKSDSNGRWVCLCFFLSMWHCDLAIIYTGREHTFLHFLLGFMNVTFTKNLINIFLNLSYIPTIVSHSSSPLLSPTPIYSPSLSTPLLFPFRKASRRLESMAHQVGIKVGQGNGVWETGSQKSVTYQGQILFLLLGTCDLK